MFFPWHEQAWQYLLNRRGIGKFPHAILLRGKDGVGKSFFARNLAALLLCQGSVAKIAACGTCGSCILLRANNHPDLIIIQPEEQGKMIKVDQIREMIIDLNNTSHQGGMKVVIIEAAEMLNVAAANALLKTLEEPALAAVIILVSANSMLLPATVRSRCQTLLIPTPKYFVAQTWLKEQLPNADSDLLLALTENAPLKALDIAASSVLLKRQEFFKIFYDFLQGKVGVSQMVEHCLERSLDDVLVILMYIVRDLVKLKFAISISKLVNRDQIEGLTNFAAKADINKLFFYQEHLDSLRRHLFNKINLNQQLVIENLMIKLLEVS